jgi:hypothetical protein
MLFDWVVLVSFINWMVQYNSSLNAKDLHLWLGLQQLVLGPDLGHKFPVCSCVNVTRSSARRDVQ